jgi:ferredoxin
MIRVEGDRETCMGYGNCVLVAPDLFTVDEEGLVVVKAELVDDAELEAVRRAEYDCPTDSISFEELPSPG